MDSHTSSTVETGTINGVTFELRYDAGEWRWYRPDGAPTDIVAESIPLARRKLAFLGWRYAPSVD